MNLVTVGNQRSPKDPKTLSSTKCGVRETLRLPVFVAESFFFLEQHVKTIWGGPMDRLALDDLRIGQVILLQTASVTRAAGIPRFRF